MIVFCFLTEPVCFPIYNIVFIFIKKNQINNAHTNIFVWALLIWFFFYKNKYYIIDWKTNWLGEKAEDYHSENLYKAMLKHNYFLQYFLYYLAMEKDS